MEAIQSMAEAAGSRIWPPGERGPICGSSQHGCRPAARHTAGAVGAEQGGTGEGKKITPREIIYVTLISAQILP